MSGLILDHLWQSTLFAALAGLLTLALRRNSAQIRYMLWFAASMKFLVPFAALTALGGAVAAFVMPPVSAPSLFVLRPMAQPFSGDLALAGAPGPDWAQILPPILFVLWAVGFAAVTARWLLRWSRLRRTLRQAVDCPLAAPVPVKMAPSPLEPGLVGIWRPVILLPQGITERLSQAEMDAVLTHEICHLRRRDNLLAATHMLVEALFWFHPLIWWLGARLNEEREHACDESVLAAGQTPQVYAESILKVCKFYLHSPLDCAAGISGADLKKRMEMIMENRIAMRLNAMKKILLATCAATALAAPLVLGLLTAPPAVAPAMAQAANAPHPGTEAALRRQIEGWEKKEPDLDGLGASMVQETKKQQADIQKTIDGWGPLKSITFKENGPDGDDVYLVTFAHGVSVWKLMPLVGGKISGMGFGPAVARADNGPSPGLEAAIRRELAGSLAGKPPYEIMSPELQTIARQDLPNMHADIESLGTVQNITFQKVNAEGWDVYHVTFANGSATVSAEPLKDGKLNGVFHSDVSVPHAAAHVGTEAWMRRHVASLLKGTPNYDEMKPGLVKAVQQQYPDQQSLFKSLGPLQSLTFEGGGDHGTDVYLVTFQNGKIRWNIEAPDASGKVGMLRFQTVK